MFCLVIEQGFECSKAPTSDSVSSVFSWALFEEFIAVLFCRILARNTTKRLLAENTSKRPETRANEKNTKRHQRKSITFTGHYILCRSRQNRLLPKQAFLNGFFATRKQESRHVLSLGCLCKETERGSKCWGKEDLRQ